MNNMRTFEFNAREIVDASLARSHAENERQSEDCAELYPQKTVLSITFRVSVFPLSANRPAPDISQGIHQPLICSK